MDSCSLWDKFRRNDKRDCHVRIERYNPKYGDEKKCVYLFGGVGEASISAGTSI